jgi:hypothetical protein
MGVATKLKFDSGDLIVERVQDCEPILDRNAALRSMAQKSDVMRHVASIPCVIMERWLNEELERGNTTIKMFGPEMDKLVQKKLRDPDWKWLRVDK